jgi:hypothetical protein
MALHETQKKIILIILLEGGEITAREATRDLEIYRLAAVIHFLRRKNKVPIVTILVRKYKNGKIIRYAKYRIPHEELEEQRERFGM